MKPARALVAAAVLLLSTGAALAEGSKLDDAKRAFGAGDQAYAAGQYLAAARAYENAYELYPLPSITFSTAQAYRLHYFEDQNVEWLEKAQALYKRYLTEQPDGGRRAHAVTHLGNIELLLAARAHQEPSADEKVHAATELLVSSVTPGASASIDGAAAGQVPVVRRVTAGTHRVRVLAPGFFETELDVIAVERRLVIVPIDLKARPGSLRVLAADDSDVSIDGRFVARTPLAAALELPAGRHAVSVSARGRSPVSHSMKIERGKQHTLRVDLGTSGQRRAAQWTLAGAGAFALLGGAMAIAAVVSEDQAKDARSGKEEGRSLTEDEMARYNDALERRDRYRTLSLASLGVSAVAGAAGTLLFVFDNPTPRPTARDSAKTYGLGYRGQF